MVDLRSVRNSRYLLRHDWPQFAWRIATLRATVDFDHPEILSTFLPPTLRTITLFPTQAWVLLTVYDAVRSALSSLVCLEHITVDFLDEPLPFHQRVGFWILDILVLLPWLAILTHLSIIDGVLTEVFREAIEGMTALVSLCLKIIRGRSELVDTSNLLDSTMRSITSTSLRRLDLDLAFIKLDCNSISHLTSLHTVKIKMPNFGPSNLLDLANLVNLRKIRINVGTLYDNLTRTVFLALMRSWPYIHQAYFLSEFKRDSSRVEIHLADLPAVAAYCPLLRKLEMRIQTHQNTLIPPITSRFHPNMNMSVKTVQLQENDVPRLTSVLKALRPQSATVSSLRRWLSCDRLDVAPGWTVQFYGKVVEGPPRPTSATWYPSDSEFDDV